MKDFKSGKKFFKGSGAYSQIYGSESKSGNKLNWERLKYKGKKFIAWNETAPEDRLHDWMVNDFFKNRKKYRP